MKPKLHYSNDKQDVIYGLRLGKEVLKDGGKIYVE